MNYQNYFHKIIRKIERFEEFEVVILFLKISFDLINFLTFIVIILFL